MNTNGHEKLLNHGMEKFVVNHIYFRREFFYDIKGSINDCFMIIKLLDQWHSMPVASERWKYICYHIWCYKKITSCWFWNRIDMFKVEKDQNKAFKHFKHTLIIHLLLWKNFMTISYQWYSALFQVSINKWIISLTSIA